MIRVSKIVITLCACLYFNLAVPGATSEDGVEFKVNLDREITEIITLSVHDPDAVIPKLLTVK